MKYPVDHFPANHQASWNDARRYHIRLTCECDKSFVCHDTTNYYDLQMEGKVWDAFRAHYKRDFDNSPAKMPWNGTWEGTEYTIKFF